MADWRTDVCVVGR